MAKRKFRPQPGQHQPAPQQVKLDLGNAETMKCEYCGNYIFMKGTVIKTFLILFLLLFVTKQNFVIGAIFLVGSY